MAYVNWPWRHHGEHLHRDMHESWYASTQKTGSNNPNTGSEAMLWSTSLRGASIAHILLARKRIKGEFLQIRMYLEHSRYRTSMLVWRSMITMVKLNSFDTFDMQWMVWVCYRIVCYTRPLRAAFHHQKGDWNNKPSMAFSVAPSSSLGRALNLFIFLICSEDRGDELDKSGRTTRTKYQCIYNSQWRHHDRQPCVQCSSEKRKEKLKC